MKGPAKSRVCFCFEAAVWLQPDTVTAKHLILFRLCEDVGDAKEAALNEGIIGADSRSFPMYLIKALAVL